MIINGLNGCGNGAAKRASDGGALLLGVGNVQSVCYACSVFYSCQQASTRHQERKGADNSSLRSAGGLGYGLRLLGVSDKQIAPRVTGGSAISWQVSL